MKLYSCFDKLAQKTICTFQSPSDGMAVRENVRAISRIIPLGDCELRCVGEIDDEKCIILPYDSFSVVSWDSYKFPESPLKPLDKDSEIKPTQFIQN